MSSPTSLPPLPNFHIPTTPLELLQSLPHLTLYAVATFFTYFLLNALRRMFFHPLSSYPGPKLWATTNLWHIYLVLQGTWVHRVLELHERYGPVVRVGPDEISYVGNQAWSEIYKAYRDDGAGAGAGERKQLKKFMPDLPATEGRALFDQMDDAVHGRLRRVLAPGLSAGGVREREGMLRRYLGLFLEGLRREMKKGESFAVVDMVAWFQCYTIDVTGQMLSGRDFGCLTMNKDNQSSLDANSVNNKIKASSGPSPDAMGEANYEFLKELAIGSAFQRNWFLTRAIVRRNPPPEDLPFKVEAKKRFEGREKENDAEKKGEELNLLDRLRNAAIADDEDAGSNAEVSRDLALKVCEDLLLAGMDTVAITLSGTIYLLLSNLDKLQKLIDEIRGVIKSEEDITLANVNGLKYLNAVIQEAMRLWPPGPETTKRVTDPKGRGQTIQGKWVPPGSLVGVYHWVAGRYTGAWLDASRFVPERWLSAEVIGESKQGDEEYARYHDYDDHSVINSFHVGPRNCVGQNLAMAQMRLVLTGLVWEFEMGLEDGGDPRGDGKDWMETKIFGLVAEKRPLMVRVRRRERV